MDGVSIVGSGTQTTTVSTEHDLVSDSAGGVYAALIDLAAMQAGDTVEIRFYSRVEASGTLRQTDLKSYSGVQDGATVAASPHKDFDGRAWAAVHGGKLTLKQTAGTSRSIPWILHKVSP